MTECCALLKLTNIYHRDHYSYENSTTLQSYLCITGLSNRLGFVQGVRLPNFHILENHNGPALSIDAHRLYHLIFKKRNVDIAYIFD